ncbi:MAG TPA: S8 family serine peptidase [Thermoanaerobaculia bacterium]|nr:S8 family serine peptidase [Thermoanaerobaculia bacterium]
MSGAADRSAAALLAFALALGGGRAAAAQPPAEGALVLAVFVFSQEAYWGRLVGELAQRFDAESVYSWTMRSLDQECVAFRLRAGRDPEPLLQALRSDRRVALAAPVQRFRTLGEPAWNDAYSGLQRGIGELGLATAHRVATGRGVKVAVVDTGVDFSHPDLADRVAEARSYVEGGEESFTRDAHGTAVAGVISAAANNGVGIVGVAPAAQLVALKACWPAPPGSRQASCDTYTLAQAIDHAIVSGARVLNLSLAGPEDALLRRLIEGAESSGVLVVAAADGSGQWPFPASVDSVLAVASDEPAGPSAVGQRPSPAPLVAPGYDILTTGPGGTYDFFTGSSFAAAHVSGVAALLLEARPSLTPAELRRILAAPAVEDAPHPVHLSACASLARATGTVVCAPAPAREETEASSQGNVPSRDPL